MFIVAPLEVLPPGPGSYDPDVALFGDPSLSLGTGLVAQQRRSANNLRHHFIKTVPVPVLVPTTGTECGAGDLGFQHPGKWTKGATAERHRNVKREEKKKNLSFILLTLLYMLYFSLYIYIYLSLSLSLYVYL